jgi:Phytanoyl-CoA dioxygenase (PhyH)
MQRRIFNDKREQEIFERDGVLCLPALNSGEIDRLTELFQEIIPVEKTGIYSNVQDQPAKLNYRISKRLIESFQPFIEQHFVNYTVGGGTFLVKHSIPDSGSNPHQDFTLVDENEFTSFNIWCPLISVNEANGCLQAVKGSHRLFSTIRSINLPSLSLDFSERLKKHLTAFPVEAGTAVIYAHNVFHGSKPNFSKETRIAAVVGLVPKDSVRKHFLKDNGKIRIVKAEEDFFFEGIPRYRKEGKFGDLEDLGSISLKSFEPLSEEKFFMEIEKNKDPLRNKIQFVRRLFQSR